MDPQSPKIGKLRSHESAFTLSRRLFLGAAATSIATVALARPEPARAAATPAETSEEIEVTSPSYAGIVGVL